MNRYRLRYSRWVQRFGGVGPKGGQKQSFAVEFEATDDGAHVVARKQWQEIQQRGYTALDFIEVVQLTDIRP